MRILKLTLLLLSMLTIMAAGIIAPSLPALAEVFQDTPHAALLSKLILSVPAIFIAVSAPVAGRFIDKHGRLRLLYMALLLYAAGGSSGYMLNNIYHILVGRALLGIAIGIIMTITITLIGDYFEGDERQAFIGYQSAFIGMAGVIFLPLGGILADISWRTPFLVYALPLLFLPLIFVFLYEPGRNERPRQVPALTSNRLLHIIFINAIVYMILFYILPTQLPFLLIDIGFEQKTLVGTVLAVNAIGMVISSFFYSRIKRQMHFPNVYTVALLLMAIGYFITGMSDSLFIILAALFIAGLGLGLFLSNTNLWVIELTPPEFRGRNLGTLTTCLFLGQFFSPLVTEPLVRGFDLSFLFSISGGIMVIMSLIFWGASQHLMKLNAKSKDVKSILH